MCALQAVLFGFSIGINVSGNGNLSLLSRIFTFLTGYDGCLPAASKTHRFPVWSIRHRRCIRNSHCKNIQILLVNFELSLYVSFVGGCPYRRDSRKIFERLDHECLHPKEQGCIRGRKQTVVRTIALVFRLCQVTRLYRTCYIAVLLYICGFVVIGAGFQDKLSVGSVIMGWGIAEVATMVNTVAVCE